MENQNTENVYHEEENGYANYLLFVSLAIGLIILFFLVKNLLTVNSLSNKKQQNFLQLIHTEEIAALSVSEFVYNGIAQPLKEDGEIDYNVLYESTIKVSLDATDIQYIVNNEQKTVTFVFPEFKIEDPVIDIASIRFMPSKSNLLMDRVIAQCKEDARSEIKQSEKLITAAQENLKTIVEAWYSSVLEGYSFEYRFTTAKGGTGND